MKRASRHTAAVLLFALIPMLAVAETTNTSAQVDTSNGTLTSTVTDPDGNTVSQNYQFARQGVFGCNLTGSYAMSVGAMSAVGGVYVPVNDAAVTLNTGYLVYKECVLRGIVVRERESALAAMAKQNINTIETGRNGNPLFWQGPQDNVDRATKDIVYFLQNNLSNINPAFRQQAVQSLARSAMAAMQKPDSPYTCSYASDLSQVWSGQDQSSAAWDALRDQRCNPLFATQFAQSAQNSYVSAGQAEMMWRLSLNNGFYDIDRVDENNQHIVLTPGSLNSAIAQQTVTSGWRQTESANDVDQMIGALFAGLGTQILSSAQGLIGLTQKIGSQPSYLNQVAAESAAGLRNSAANAAIQILTAALQVEKTYNQIVGSIATTLTGTIQQLRTVENQCWALVIQNVCQSAPAADGTCTSKPQGACTTDPSTGQQTCPQGIPLKVSTSTSASQQIIQSQVTPLANQTVTNIQNSDKALQLINQLVSGVTNTTSVDAQRIALVQLDQLVTQGALHNQTQLTTVQQQQAAIKDSMSTLVNDTKTAWADSTDPNVGWCNINNPSVIQMWIQRWTK